MCRRDNEEHRIQVACVDWAKWNEHRFEGLDLLYAIPNGGKRPIKTAIQMKKEGVRPGIPDLHLPVPRLTYNSLYIETKAKKGRLSKAQKKIFPKLVANGHRVIVVKSLTDFQLGVCTYLDSIDVNITAGYKPFRHPTGIMDVYLKTRRIG